MIPPSDVEEGEPASHAPTHRVPIIDKMMEVLRAIELEHGAGLRINSIVSATGLPRSTVYRVLNTLTFHGMLHRSADGRYQLGLRLKGLAKGVTLSLTREDVLLAVRPALKVLSERTRQTSKFTVLDHATAKVVALEIGTDPFAPTSRLGSTFDLHAGAASKLLLANMPLVDRKEILGEPRARHTPATIVDLETLSTELAVILETGISHDRGEWSGNVHAVAAPVVGPDGAVLGALSVTYFPRPDEPDFGLGLIDTLREVATEVSARLARGAIAATPGDAL